VHVSSRSHSRRRAEQANIRPSKDRCELFSVSISRLTPIDAKQSYSLPIEAVTRNRIKIRPDGMELVLCEVAFTHLVSWFRFCMEHGKLQLDGFQPAIKPYSNLSLSGGRECTISLSPLG
jgi:hypothetical protein